MKTNYLKKCLLLFVSLGTPLTVGAFINTGWIILLLEEIHGVARTAVPILIGVALLVFVWGVIKFMTTDEERTRDAGKRQMLWGVLGLFVVVSVWGLVALLGTLLGVKGKAALPSPQYYFQPAPPSGSGGDTSGPNSCQTTGICSNPVWSCYAPCCPDIYVPCNPEDGSGCCSAQY